jgi:hypothetical protein
MKYLNSVILFSAAALFIVLPAVAERGVGLLISADMAAIIVAKEERAREHSKDQREVKLLGAPIVESAVADLGSHKVIFNLIGGSPNLDSQTQKISASVDPAKIEATMKTLLDKSQNYKEPFFFSLSGIVYDNSITEIWWHRGGKHYRVFINANFLYLEGIGEFEDASRRYSIFSLFTGSTVQNAENRGKWVPSMADFSPDTLECLVVEWGDETELDDVRFNAIDAMLSHYQENYDAIKVDYDNRRTIDRARREYLRQNPPKQRDKIINYRLFDPKLFKANPR